LADVGLHVRNVEGCILRYGAFLKVRMNVPLTEGLRKTADTFVSLNIKQKIKFTVVQTMKVHKGRKVIAPLFL